MAMVAVGLWAAQSGGRRVWSYPLAFVLSMLAGGGAALFGQSLPLVEQTILLTLVLLGIGIACAWRTPAWLGVGLIGMAGLAHGFAHGTEIPLNATGEHFLFGMLVATALLHAAGVSFALWAQSVSRPQMVRWMGGVMAGTAVLLAITSFFVA